MARGPVHNSSLTTTAEKLAARAEAVAKIEALLQEGPKTMPEIIEAVGGLRSTLFSYLRYMRERLRTVRLTGETRGRSVVWALGEDDGVPTIDAKLDQLMAVKRGTAPAKQLGLHRDPLVAALFGPARHNIEGNAA